MLSIENPPSTDSNPCQVKKKNRVGYTEKKNVPNLPDLDPPPPSSSSSSFFDHHHNRNNNQIPRFSIRDYVFTRRRKDIKKNWPFTLENLQLCFKYGVKDPLPPFQKLAALRNQSSEPRTVETISGIIKGKLDGHGKLENSQTIPELTAVNPPLKSKTETMNKNSNRRCRLVVRFGSVPSEDVSSSSAAVSEPMASSKTCPVCKSFSSSSNTTLNAHIDQCLSADSKPELQPSSRLFVKHKIKPRKIRLMTDIYATAKPETLEELDRRNGRSWASLASSLPALESNQADLSSEVENQGLSPACSLQATGDVPPVYTDSSGRKVRILSKFDDAMAVTKETMDIGPSKSLKGNKGEKCFSTKKKRCLGKKRHKYLKLVPQSRQLLSQKAHTSQVSAGLEGYSREEYDKDELQRGKQCEPVQLPGTSRQWTPLKAAAPTKGLNKKGCKRKRSAENDQPRLGKPLLRRIHRQKLTVPSGNKVGDTERFLLPMKRKTNCLGKVSPCSRDGPTLRNRVSSLQRKKFCPVAIDVSDISQHASLRKPVTRTPTSGSRTLKSSSAGKTESIRHQSENEPFSSSPKKQFSTEKTQPQLMGENDEHLLARETRTGQDSDLMHNGTDHIEDDMASKDSSFATPVLPSREEIVASKSLWMVSPHHQDNGESTDPFLKADLHDDESDSDNNNEFLEGFDGQETIVGRATCQIRFVESTPFDSLQSADDTLACPGGEPLLRLAGPSLPGTQGTYSAHGIADGIIPKEAANMGTDFDIEEADQRLSFPEVEPIPIPGPPGSFLPSPRGFVNSDDFQGNSSLTSSPVRSSEDHNRDFIGRNSSDSLVSMASTISNSTAGKPDHVKYLEEYSAGAASVLDMSSLGFPTAEVETAIDSSAASSQQTTAGNERSFDGKTYSISKVRFEKKPFGFRNDDQPCCCQTKERTSQGFIPLNYRESQLLKRRTMASTERQVGMNSNLRPDTTAGLSNFPFSAHEKIPPIPVRKPSAEEPALSKRASDIDHTSSSPSASTPILRLMGKNLMVINTEENASVSSDHGVSVSTNNNPASHFSGASSASPSSFRNRDGLSLSHGRRFLGLEGSSESGSSHVANPLHEFFSVF